MQHLVERGDEHALGYQHVTPVRPADDEASDAIGQLGELCGSDNPFYLEVGFEEPHRPYDFGGARPDMSRGVAVPPYLPDTSESREDFAAFQGAIRQMDSAVGRILVALAELGLAESTLVVFATDHGAAMPRAKCTLYDPGIEVALLMRWPARDIGGGRVVSDLVSNVDIAPTVLEALELALPPTLHGRSVWPLLRHAEYVPRQEIFAEKTYHTHYEPMRAIRGERYKLIANLEVGLRFDVPADIMASPMYPLMLPSIIGTRPPIELFDLATDRWEQTNLADMPELAKVQAELGRRLLSWMQETDDPLLRGSVTSPFLANALTRLRA
jgi:N-sulfoglucosamine sulfohydrolase